MKLNHLALSVRDQQRSIDFYARYFGFDPSTARRYPDGVIIVHDSAGFALALGPDDGSDRAPGFPHFGFDLDSPEAARELLARLLTDGIRLVEEEDTDAYVGFKCLDPDDHVIEAAWEPEEASPNTAEPGPPHSPRKATE